MREAIHATETNYEWTQCSGIINYNYSDVEASVIPLYQDFLAAGDMKILVFSGGEISMKFRDLQLTCTECRSTI